MRKKIVVRSKLKVGGSCLGADMCAYNVFFENFKFMGFYDCLKILRRINFFTPYSVDVGDFFTTYSVDVGDLLPHTQ